MWTSRPRLQPLPSNCRAVSAACRYKRRLLLRCPAGFGWTVSITAGLGLLNLNSHNKKSLYTSRCNYMEESLLKIECVILKWNINLKTHSRNALETAVQTLLLGAWLIAYQSQRQLKEWFRKIVCWPCLEKTRSGFHQYLLSTIKSVHAVFAKSALDYERVKWNDCIAV